MRAVRRRRREPHSVGGRFSRRVGVEEAPGHSAKAAGAIGDEPKKKYDYQGERRGQLASCVRGMRSVARGGSRALELPAVRHPPEVLAYRHDRAGAGVRPGGGSMSPAMSAASFWNASESWPPSHSVSEAA